MCDKEHSYAEGADVEVVTRNVPRGHVHKQESLGFRFDLCERCYQDFVRTTQQFVSFMLALGWRNRHERNS